MCGIAGLVDLNGRRDFSRDLLARMNDIQFHRGPDEGGFHFEPGVALAHRRLSIIDVATGQQPLFNEDGSVVVVFNGEIYNFQELVPELEALGHVFRTHSDTEVIVHAWEAWGEACVERFRGMLAFALWDRNRETLFLARDRLGVKPLFYAYLQDGTLAFGSELKVLMQHPALDRRIDPQAVEEYFALGYTAEPRTIFRGAAKLEPGHLLVLRRGQRAANPRAYWDVRFTLDNPMSLGDAMAELDGRLHESIRMRMISEVPLGAFLSGGVDSSAVVATMADLAGGPVKTCSIGFDDPDTGGRITVIRDVSLRVPPGEFLVLIGRSGCGKTTLLNAVAGLVEISSGSLSVLGGTPKAARRDTGYMFARDAMIPWRNARRNVEFGLEIRGVGKAERREARAATSDEG